MSDFVFLQIPNRFLTHQSVSDAINYLNTMKDQERPVCPFNRCDSLPSCPLDFSDTNCCVDTNNCCESRRADTSCCVDTNNCCESRRADTSRTDNCCESRCVDTNNCCESRRANTTVHCVDVDTSRREGERCTDNDTSVSDEILDTVTDNFLDAFFQNEMSSMFNGTGCNFSYTSVFNGTGPSSSLNSILSSMLGPAYPFLNASAYTSSASSSSTSTSSASFILSEIIINLCIGIPLTTAHKDYLRSTLPKFDDLLSTLNELSPEEWTERLTTQNNVMNDILSFSPDLCKMFQALLSFCKDNSEEYRRWMQFVIKGAIFTVNSILEQN